jgi:hypothetical protein
MISAGNHLYLHGGQNVTGGSSQRAKISDHLLRGLAPWSALSSGVDMSLSSSRTTVRVGDIHLKIAMKQCIKISAVPWGCPHFHIFVSLMEIQEYRRTLYKGRENVSHTSESWSYLTQPIKSNTRVFHYAIINNPDALCSSPRTYVIG